MSNERRTITGSGHDVSLDGHLADVTHVSNVFEDHLVQRAALHVMRKAFAWTRGFSDQPRHGDCSPLLMGIHLAKTCHVLGIHEHANAHALTILPQRLIHESETHGTITATATTLSQPRAIENIAAIW
jgi:hypothetical protein